MHAPDGTNYRVAFVTLLNELIKVYYNAPNIHNYTLHIRTTPKGKPKG